MKVLVGTTEISGIARSLVSGFNEIGIFSAAVFSAPHPFTYGESDGDLLTRIWQRLGALRSKISRNNLIYKVVLLVSHKSFCWILFLRSLFIFTAYIFVFGKTFTNTVAELSILKFFKKKIVFIYLGSDARLPFTDGPSFIAEPSAEDFVRAMLLSKKISSLVQCQESYADYVINAPATGHYHLKPFINWFSMGVPVTIPCKMVSPKNVNAVTRILHSPSHPIAKGSTEISAVIDRLRLKGHQIDFIQLERVPNAVVLDELSRCDFIIDQLYSDTPMAVFATEAAHFGKPAVVGGYFSSCIHDFVSEEEMPPSLYVHPADLEEAVERLIVDIDYREQLGLRAKEFVETRWSPRAVAERYLRVLKGDIPESWMCDPKRIHYLRGGGIPESRLKLIVRGLIENFGIGALALSEKPELEKAFLNFALK